MTEKLKKEINKKVEKLIPIDNDAFPYFAKNKEFCEEFLRVVLEDDNLVVIDNEPQKKLSNVYFKEVVLDMICKLSDGRIVNVEIQLYKDEDSARRIFQYASMIRSTFVKKGTKYKDIKDIIIIYLTKDDIFHKGNTTYEVDMKIKSDTGVYVKDFDCGLKILYINTKGATKENVNEYLKVLSDRITYNNKYLITTNLKKDLFKKGGNGAMSPWFNNLLEVERKEGRQEGMQQGMQQGMQEGMQRVLDNLVSKGIISREDADKELAGVKNEIYA